MARRPKREAQQLLLSWYEQMVLCFETELSNQEQHALQRWESSPDFTRTSDWPGWERHIGKRPQPVPASSGRGRKQA